MSTAPPKPIPLAHRERLQFNEVLERWHWSENDLKEAVIAGHLVPSIYERGALWPMRSTGSGKRCRITPAVFSDRWMYAVGANPTGPFNCSFDYLASTYNALTNHEEVYLRDGSGFVNNRITLADVIERGAFAREEIERYETEHGVSSTIRDAATEKRKPWWQAQYDIFSMAAAIEARWDSEDRNVNQSGARAGKFSLTALGEAVAAEIGKTEKTIKSPRTIGGKSIKNYLEKNGWN